MQKVFLIIQREYLSRVKKKSFLILTFLVPSLFIGMYAVIFLIYQNGDNKAKEFKVLDKSEMFTNEFKNKSNLNFTYINGDYEKAKKEIRNEKDNFLLYIPADYDKTGNVEIVAEKKPGIAVVNDIETQLGKIYH